LESKRDAEPIRVLWVADTVAHNAGTERQIMEIGRRMDPRKFELHLATFEDDQPAAAAEIFDHTIFPLISVWTAQGARQVLRMASMIRSKKISIVHGFMHKASIVGTLAGKLGGAPIILTSRRDLGYYQTPRSLAVLRLLNPLATRITANCEAARLAASQLEKVDLAKIDVLYNGVDLHAFRNSNHASAEPAVPVPADGKVVGIVANYRPVKDLPLFLKAAAVVASEEPETVFLLVGTGTMEPELKELARSLRIADRTIFTCGRGAVPAYLHRMSVACLSSASEGLSNSILEYMAAGLPVVATDAGGNRELIVDGRTGFLVRERTPHAFAAPILRLLRDGGMRSAFGRAGLERCQEMFEMSVAVQNTQKYYEELIANVRAGAK
jgi:glycosyltransferase involved in cell wall biosynthesis